MNAPAHAAQLHPRPAPQALLDALSRRFGAQFSTAQAVREQHGRDEGSIQAPPPAAVVFAESTQDVQDAMRLAAQHEVPVIAYGAGSSPCRLSPRGARAAPRRTSRSGCR